MTLTLITTEELKLRPIVTRDLFTVVKVVVPRLDMIRIREIMSSMPADDKGRNEYFQVAGMEILMMVLNVAVEEEIQEWLADLVGLTHEQFLDSSVDTSFKIVQLLWQNEEVSRLFRTLLQ